MRNTKSRVTYNYKFFTDLPKDQQSTWLEIMHKNGQKLLSSSNIYKSPLNQPKDLKNPRLKSINVSPIEKEFFSR